MLKLLADENVHSEIIAYLRSKGYEIITAIDEGLAGSKDYEVLAYTEKHDRILLTGDKDFGGLLEFGILYGRGKVILLRYTTMNIKVIAEAINGLLKKENRLFKRVKSLLIVLSEGRYRIHHF